MESTTDSAREPLSRTLARRVHGGAMPQSHPQLLGTKWDQRSCTSASISLRVWLGCVMGLVPWELSASSWQSGDPDRKR